MRRRDFIKAVAGSAAIWPLAAGAQQLAKSARIGWMSRGNRTVDDPFMDAFRRGMRELGYVDGQSFVIEARYADGNPDLMPGQAAELERAGVDVIMAGPFEAVQAAKQSTSRVPIVMTPSADPATAGIIESLDHPGGNITGITEMMPELTSQRLGLLKQIVPTLRRVAILWQPGTLSEATFGQMLKETQATAGLLDVHVQIVGAKIDDLDAAFSAMVTEHAEGLIVLVNPIYGVHNKLIIERAMNQKLPVIYEWKLFVRNGGLISYGADNLDVYRRAAELVDRILKGAKPADLPVEKPIKSETSINLKTAKALGLTVPPSILLRADEVIE
jgi:putative ABC transport system substrate-binding protein